jgi:PAS domain S-box-containing protein
MNDPNRTEDHLARELVLENEARLNLHLDGANVGLFEWNFATNQSQWSTGFYRMHGLQPNATASYEVWRSQLHPDDQARVEADIQRAMDQTDAVDTDYRIVHPDGELRWTLLQARVQRDAEGRPVAMSGYCGDITRRKLADAALLESEKLAIAGRMSAALAHEINNPLEAAYNLIYLARTSAAEDDQAQFLDEAIEQLQRVSEISHQTLKFVRPTPPRVVKVSEVVVSTLRLLAPKLSIAAVDPITDLSERCELFCSPGELQQILTNILNNAAEASSKRRKATIRVRNSFDWTSPETPGVRITLADTGPGMTPETLRRLREPFYTTKDGTGTGLGVWVVQELVAKLKGRIAIRSSTHPAHCGTAISLFFPSAARNDAEQVLPPQAKIASAQKFMG